MKLKLNIKERIAMQGVLPKNANYVTLQIIEQIRTKLSFSENELKKGGVTQAGENFSWKNDFEEEFEIGEKMMEIIKNNLIGMNANGTLHSSMMSLYEKLILEKE